jgi:hypothetical protein
MEDSQFNTTESIKILKGLVKSGASFKSEFSKLLTHYEQLERDKKHNGVTLASYVILLYLADRLRDVEFLRGNYKVYNYFNY